MRKTHLALWASISSEVGPFWTWRWTAGPGHASQGSREKRADSEFSPTIGCERQQQQLKLVPAEAINEQMTRIWVAARSLHPTSSRQPLMCGERRAKFLCRGGRGGSHWSYAESMMKRERAAGAGRLHSSSHALITIIWQTVRLTHSRCSFQWNYSVIKWGWQCLQIAV